MAKKKKSAKAAFMTFNVVYEDGTLSSNRRVASELLDDSFGDDVMHLARTAIEDQDNEIAQRSGIRKGKIKTIKPV
ncbi:MAG: hypothetical protein OQJ76_04295 [Rhodospirillales bacterium]|nr:hypothetical protein [Rhodospirillales bacterium]MCW8969844.1 hypothetical protein [Rhodospirillales bacterium]MCW9039696.1 hypothetical protein [Rhodospirillales bacterium]